LAVWHFFGKSDQKQLMFRHTLLIIFRNFKRFKGSFLINLIGLSSGLACALIVYLWVNDELLVDKFHLNGDRIYKMMEFQKNSDANIRVTDSTPGLLADELVTEIPEVESAVTVTPSEWFNPFTLSVGETLIESRGIYASREFFKIFSFKLLQGMDDKVLEDKNSIVISEATANSLFGTTENVVGKTIEFQHERDFFVTGVFKNVSAHSSQQFDFVLSFDVLKDATPGVARWENSGPMTFALLKQGADVQSFNRKASGIISKHIAEKHRSLFSTKFSDTYLHNSYNEQGVQSGGRIDYVIMFSVIACFILAIACINFMNLSTAKATRRIKEVGIKKSIGASRSTLIIQYLSESMLTAFASLVLAVLIVDIMLPQFNGITGKNLSLYPDPRLILAFLSITVFTGLFAGSYPAIYISRFNPAQVLKGRFSGGVGEVLARKGLVIFQFSISVIFIVSVLVVYRQIQFLQTKHLGYNKENIIHFPMEGKLISGREAFLAGLRGLRGVEHASSISQSMVGGGNTTSLEWEGKDPGDNTPFAIRPVNYHVIEMLDMQIVEGRSFSPEIQDSLAVVFNETAVKVMGLKDPVGRTVSFGGIKASIIGVVKDFHFESLRVDVQPMFFVFAPQYTQKIMVKLSAGDEIETVERIGSYFRQFNPGFTFDFRFMDQDYEEQYYDERRIAVLSRYFAGMAILISCLGLFGLAAFTAQRRVKEIGIRKVLGSSDLSIVYLLSIDFTRVVFVSIVIALPISYFILKQWLDNFAYKIPLAWWYFLGSGILALCIAWLTVATQALRASRINPVDCLKNE
jgi:predicted permease